MAKEIIISEQENIAATFEDGKISEFFMNEGEQLVGDIILGKVDSIIQSIDAAFVSIGKNRNGFIHITDLSLKNAKKRIGIKNHVHPRQNLLVQIAKEATGSKGPRLTGMLTIPGKYMVLTPYERKVGISKKITDVHERDRLVYISKKICQSGYGIIIRTEAIGQPETALKEDLDFLLKRWSEILRMSETMTAPAVLYRDQDLLYRVLRDAITPDVEKIVVDTPDGKNRAIDLLQSWTNKAAGLVQQSRINIPLSQQYNIFTEIETALQPKVPLPSGGYLIIERTEALTVIDVNSGSTKGTGLNETILQTNKESAVEIARQLKLRDIGGVIVVDFIDMLDQRDQQIIWQMLANATKNDKAQPQIGYFSEFSLLEMTRHRQKKSITELLTSKCPYCDGIGKIRNSVYRADLLTTDSINKRLNKHEGNGHRHEAANSKQMEEFTNSVEYVENKMDTIPQRILDQRKDNEGSNQISYPKFDRNNNKYDDVVSGNKDSFEEDNDDDIEVVEVNDSNSPIVNNDSYVEQVYNVVATEEPKKKEIPNSSESFVVELTDEERKYIESIEEPLDRRKNNYRDKKFTKNKNDFQKRPNPNSRYNNEDRYNKPRNNPNNPYEEKVKSDENVVSEKPAYSNEQPQRNENSQRHEQPQRNENSSRYEQPQRNENSPRHEHSQRQPYRTNYQQTSRVVEPLNEIVSDIIEENNESYNVSITEMAPVSEFTQNRHVKAVPEIIGVTEEAIEIIEEIVELSGISETVEIRPASMPDFIEELVIIETVAPKKRGRKPNPKKIKAVEDEQVIPQTEEVKPVKQETKSVKEAPTANPQKEKVVQVKTPTTESEAKSDIVEGTESTDALSAAKPKKRGRIKSFSPKTKKRI